MKIVGDLESRKELEEAVAGVFRDMGMEVEEGEPVGGVTMAFNGLDNGGSMEEEEGDEYQSV